MIPSAEQIRLAALIHSQLPGRTRDARIMDAIAHVRNSDKKKPTDQGRLKDTKTHEQYNAPVETSHT